jgi:hypothetical protein
MRRVDADDKLKGVLMEEPRGPSLECVCRDLMDGELGPDGMGWEYVEEGSR